MQPWPVGPWLHKPPGRAWARYWARPGGATNGHDSGRAGARCQGCAALAAHRRSRGALTPWQPASYPPLPRRACGAVRAAAGRSRGHAPQGHGRPGASADERRAGRARLHIARTVPIGHGAAGATVGRLRRTVGGRRPGRWPWVGPGAGGPGQGARAGRPGILAGERPVGLIEIPILCIIGAHALALWVLLLGWCILAALPIWGRPPAPQFSGNLFFPWLPECIALYNVIFNLPLICLFHSTINSTISGIIFHSVFFTPSFTDCRNPAIMVYIQLTICGLYPGGVFVRTAWADDDIMSLVLSAMMPANRLAIQVSEATGLRISDVLALPTDKVRAGSRFSVRDSKTGKLHRIYIPVSLRMSLLAQAGPVWCFPHRTDRAKHRTRQAVYKDMVRAVRVFRRNGRISSGVVISPHSARKRAAVRAYHRGGLDAARVLLNHAESDAAVTLLYALSDTEPTRKRRRRRSNDTI